MEHTLESGKTSMRIKMANINNAQVNVHPAKIASAVISSILTKDQLGIVLFQEPCKMQR